MSNGTSSGSSSAASGSYSGAATSGGSGAVTGIGLDGGAPSGFSGTMSGASGAGGFLGSAGGVGTSGFLGGTGGVGTSGFLGGTGGVGASGASVSGSTSGTTPGGSSGLSSGGTTPSMLPAVQGTCAPLTSGKQTITVNGTAMTWTLSVGSKTAGSGGPIVIYWHSTGGSGSEAVQGLGQASIDEIVGLGGVVASAESTSGTGTNTGDYVWYTGDVDYADQIIACATKQLNIDTRHIHTAGYSAGALQSAYMHAARSGYLASAVVYSGGMIIQAQRQDPTNVAPIIGAHGSASADFLATSTTNWEQSLKTAGGFVIDCDDGGSHVDFSRLTKLGPSTWRFFKDHPFKAGKPDPYANGLPSTFPSYCKIL